MRLQSSDVPQGEKVYARVYFASAVDLGMASRVRVTQPLSQGTDLFVIDEMTCASSHSAIEAARQLLLEYGHFVQAQPHIATFCFGALEQEAAALPAGPTYDMNDAGAFVARYRLPKASSPHLHIPQIQIGLALLPGAAFSCQTWQMLGK